MSVVIGVISCYSGVISCFRIIFYFGFILGGLKGLNLVLGGIVFLWIKIVV